MKRDRMLSLIAGMVLSVWGLISWALMLWNSLVVMKEPNKADISKSFFEG